MKNPRRPRVTSTARHTAEMRLDDSSPVGFRVEDVPLGDAKPGSVNAFLEENGPTGRPVLIDLSANLTVLMQRSSEASPPARLHRILPVNAFAAFDFRQGHFALQLDFDLLVHPFDF
jgi:hypothetical protein